MKTEKYVNGKAYNQLGYCLHIVLTVLGVVSFLMMLGYTGSCELNVITMTEYTVRVIPCLAVFGGSILIHNKIFD